jgi:Cu2+-containing amine oxidase
MTQVQRCHPLASLSTTKLSVAIAIVRAAGCEFAVKYYPSFNEAIQRIYVNDIALVMVDHSCSGYCSEADAHYCRTGNSLLCCRTDSDSLMENGYARSVEGINVAIGV